MTAPRPMESAFGLQPRPGQAVFTRDGHELGSVKECATDAFKVDVARKRDYWLSIGSILSISEQRVEMDFDAQSLDAYRLDEPGGHASESPRLDATRDVFATTEEKELSRDQQMHPPQ